MRSMRKLGVVLLGLVFLPVAAWASPTFVQEHYRWRSDDGGESAATWKANQDTAITSVARGQNIRLRFDVANTSTAYSGSLVARLEYSTSTSGPWTPVSTATDGTFPFEMTTTAGYADGDSTTAQLAGSGTFAAGKAVESPNNTSAAVTIDTNRYSNFEFCFRATAKATGSTTYYFRVTTAGGVLTTYSQVATLTTAVGEANEAPVIKSALVANTLAAASFCHQIKASGTDPIAYGASNLPFGLSLVGDTISGSLSGSMVSFNIGLTATNPWGSDAKTLVITPTNTAPVANNSIATVGGGVQTAVGLSATHSDVGQTLTYALLSGPAHGTLAANPASSSWYYTPADGYAGADSFTWRVNDGVVNSGDATVLITVNVTVPVPQNQSACAAKNVAVDIPAAHTGGGGYTYTLTKLSGPSSGSVSVSGTTFHYTPSAGYIGADSFTWNMTYTGPGTGTTATATCSIWVSDASTTNWPTFRGDAFRTGMSPANLPATLQLQWRRTLPLARQAWVSAGANQVWPGAKNSTGYFSSVGVYMTIDFNYEPIAADGKVFMGSNRDDCLLAYNAATGAELWRAYTDGPIRLAPVYSNGKVYAGSDDGFIYCWDANTGVLLWKMQAVSGGGGSKLARKKVFGNLRMMSSWPVRGGLMMDNGVLYFASGLWPMEGVFVGALNPNTGKILWMNEGYCAAAGHRNVLIPQGYLVRSSGYWQGNVPPWGYFMAPCGKVQARTFPLYTGPLNGLGSLTSDFANGLAKQSGLHLDYEWALQAGSLTPDPGVVPLGEGPKNGSTWVVFHDKLDTSLDQWPSAITAGSKTYAAADVTALGVVGTVWRIIAANGRLFVLTEGSATVNPQLYCFGGDVQPTPPTWPLNVTPLVSSNDVWTTRATRILTDSGVNDKGVAFVLGIGSGRLVDELLLQSSLHVVVVEPDTNKVQVLRRKMSDAGLYGTRGSVLVGDPLNSGLPPHMGRLIVSEDISVAGWSCGTDFVKSLFRCVRPYDGKAWLYTTGGQHTTFSGWAGSAGLTNATVARDSANEFSVLTRVGALPGSCEWTAAYGPVANADYAVAGPLGVLWYGDTTVDIASGGWWTANNLGHAQPDVVNGRIVAGSGRTVDAYSGIVLSGTQNYSGWKTPAGNLSVVEQTPGLQRRSPLFGLLEQGYPYVDGVGACAHPEYPPYGRLMAGAATGISKEASFYSHDVGLIRMPFRVRCDSDCSFPANGVVMYSQEQGCACDFTLQTSLALAHDPDPENWVENFSQYCGQDLLGVSVEEAPITRLGVNFGAPKEHMNTNGMLWMSDSGIYSAPYEPGTAQRYYHHSVRMLSSEGPKWAAASGLKGATKIRIPVAWTPVAKWTDNAPTIDGNLSDACWDGASPTLLNRAGTGHGDSWFRYDGTNLYVGAVVHNPGDGTDWNSRGSWTVYLSDRTSKGVRLFIARTGETSGTITRDWSQTWGTWTGGWSGAMVWSGLTNCTAEFAIPWTALAAEGFDREHLLVNVIGPRNAQIRGGDGDSYYHDIIFGSLIGFYVPLCFDQVTGLLGSARPYKVRLHFAETEGALAGERVFDVKLQGNTVLSDFDVFTAAGGANRGIVREFTGISVGNELMVEFTPKVGDPVIGGVELEAQVGIVSALTAVAAVGRSFQYTIIASGTPPITYGASGLPAGLSCSGDVISGTPTALGTYSVTLTASNAYGTDTKTLVVTIATGVDAYGIPDAWKIQYFGSAIAPGSGALDDPDHDGMNNLAEYLAGTCPTNANSRFQVSGIRCQAEDFYLRFLTETGRLYGVKGRGDMLGTSQWVVVTNGLPGTGGYLEVRDPVTGVKKFYRITVRME